MLLMMMMMITEKVESDRLMRCDRGLAKAGVPSLKNQAGSWWSPVAVGRRLSKAGKTHHSVTCSRTCSLADWLHSDTA